MTTPPPTIGRYMGRDIVRVVDVPERKGRDIHLRDGGIIFIPDHNFAYSGVELWATDKRQGPTVAEMRLALHNPRTHATLGVVRTETPRPPKETRRISVIGKMGFGGR